MEGKGGEVRMEGKKEREGWREREREKDGVEKGFGKCG